MLVLFTFTLSTSPWPPYPLALFLDERSCCPSFGALLYCMCELPAVIFGMVVSLDITAVMWWRSWCRVTSIRSSCLHSPWALTTSKSFSTRSSEVRYTHTLNPFKLHLQRSDTHILHPESFFTKISWVEKHTGNHTHASLLHVPYYHILTRDNGEEECKNTNGRTSLKNQPPFWYFVYCRTTDMF